MSHMGRNTAALLSERKAALLDIWLNAQIADPNLRFDQFDEADLRQQSQDFLDKFVDLIQVGDFNLTRQDSPEYEAIYGILADISDRRSGQGFTAAETASYIFSLREATLQFLRDAAVNQPKIIDEVSYISRLLDNMGLMVFEISRERSRKVISQQRQEILELSTPIIHIWDGVLAVPLVGTLDSTRAQEVMENMLQEIARTGFEVVIVDISGISTVDTLVAQYLLKTFSAARLMGASCIISGIGPSIAQTIVRLGIDLQHVKTTSTLAGALQVAFDMLRLQVVSADQYGDMHGPNSDSQAPRISIGHRSSGNA